MRITSARIGMESSQSYHTFTEQNHNELVMVGTVGPLSERERKQEDAAGNLLVGEEAKKKYDGETSFEEKKNALQEKFGEMSSYSGVRKLSYLQSNRDALSTVKDRCMQYLISVFFGETKKFDCTEAVSGVRANTAVLSETVYSFQETYFKETQEALFSTKGIVKTADGRELSFDLNVEMSRSFAAYYSSEAVEIQERVLCDPLVINLEDNITNLTDQTFFFDIDTDGKKDEISILAKGSGYLALDRNQDGIINDGNELFGTRSGDGFADLSEYDADHNGWIDENDAIWEKLLIWTKDENGEDKCYRLSQKEVGAICLSTADTEFSINDMHNQVNGRIRRTGIFLYENGMAGTIQHVDMAKHEAEYSA